MPPLLSGTRVPIGPASSGSSANMKTSKESSSAPLPRNGATFQQASGGSGGKGAGGPEQKSAGASIGTSPGGATSSPRGIGKGLDRTLKGGKGISAKPQPGR